MNDDQTLEWITIFHMDEDDGKDSGLYSEIKKGKLRQGCGASSPSLLLLSGERLSKNDWEENY